MTDRTCRHRTKTNNFKCLANCKIHMTKKSWIRTFMCCSIICICILIILLAFWDRIKKSAETRIVFGRYADPKEFPYHVLLTTPEERALLCGGTIIKANWVLTAQHCILEDIPVLTVIAGTIFEIKPTEYDQIRNSTKIINYAEELIHDIALIYFDEPFKFNDYVQPALFPTENQDELGTLIAAGWGIISYNCTRISSPILKVGLIQIERANATKLYSKVSDTLVIPDTCSGDSGGGIMKKTSDKGFTIIGVVSYGPFPCSSPSKSSVYTRVKAFLDWINEKTNTKQ